jgi:hypothetical protein
MANANEMTVLFVSRDLLIRTRKIWMAVPDGPMSG